MVADKNNLFSTSGPIGKWGYLVPTGLIVQSLVVLCMLEGCTKHDFLSWKKIKIHVEIISINKS